MAVNFPNSPSNGDTFTSGGISFTYNSTDGTWASSTSASGINGLSDVDTSTNAPSTGQLLQWNGTNWVPYTHTNGITEIDQWRITANITSDASPITGTWERNDTDYSVVGTGMSQSSGIFTFPSAGVWRIHYHVRLYVNNTDSITGTIKYTTDNSTYSTGAELNYSEQLATNTGMYPSVNCEYIFNCTNTSTHKVQFTIAGLDTNNYVFGNTDSNRTFVNFLRLGDNP